VRVLVADDDPVAARILSAALRSWDLDVEVVFDGASAWAAMNLQHTPMAILDWMMPEIDGPELCRRLRANPATANAYILLLTARETSADMVHGLDAGADDYITKPFDREELRARVHVGVRVATLQEKLEDRVYELQKALADVRQLEGFLSICSYCKRIRTEEQSWEQMERYISDHSNAQFSHGICPSCFEKAKSDFGL
jgi:DNA-binding response OmpR family regulator